MNSILSITNPETLTMSSREIAELVEKRHDNVKRTIETLGKQGVISVPQIEEYRDSLGRSAKEYRIGKRDSFVIVAQLSPEFTARLVDRWQELEAQPPKHKIPESLPEALRLAADLADNLAKKEAELAIVAPKARALDLISAQKDSMTLTQAAKTCGMKVKEFIALLHAYGWVYRQNGALVAYDKYIKNGCLEYKEAVYTDEKTGLECRKPYCHVTPKGLVKLAEMFSIDLEPA